MLQIPRVLNWSDQESKDARGTFERVFGGYGFLQEFNESRPTPPTTKTTTLSIARPASLRSRPLISHAELMDSEGNQSISVENFLDYTTDPHRSGIETGIDCMCQSVYVVQTRWEWRLWPPCC